MSDGPDREEGRPEEEVGPVPPVPPATWAGRERSAEETPQAPASDPQVGDREAEAEEPEAEEAVEPEGEVEAQEEAEPEAEEDAGPQQEEEPAEPGPQEEVSAEPEPDEDETPAPAESKPGPPPDRERSTEAALAGLRARAAGKEAPVRPAPASIELPELESEGVAEAGKPPKAKPVWARFLAASLVIVISVAAATSISLLLFLTDIAAGLGGLKLAEGDLTAVDPGGPQTILILGSDKRPIDDTGRSDTAILLRVDPDKKAIALLSIPRDLKVNIPSLGVDRFNAAYAYGGPKLTLKTVKQFTGLEINHVVNVNFTGFADAVNAIDCVYIDVDRQYYVPEGSEYSAIDPPINAGYQRLCGLKALQYVRYRLNDNDLVRAARQQDFIREARQNVPPSKLISDRDELLDIFAEYTTSDEELKDPIAVFELIKTFYFVRNVPVREVHFPAELGDVYVTASEQAIQNAIDQFLGTEGTPGPQSGGSDGSDKPEDKERPGAEEEGEKKPKPKPKPKPEDQGPPMTDVSGSTLPVAQRIAQTQTKGGDAMVDFDIYFPTLAPPETQLTSLEESRAFPIDGPDRKAYRGYKLVLGLPAAAFSSEYFGVSGTNWADPPILENPSETREIEGREYQLYYDGDRLRLVGWKSKRASYWVNNTLLQTLEEGEMLAIATSMRELND